MKTFFKEYFSKSVKMFMTQLVISIFGLSLTIALGMTNNAFAQVAASAAAALFYLFMVYAESWNIGSHDIIRVDGGRLKERRLTGLYVALLANVPNILLALGTALGFAVADGGFFSSLGGSCATAALFIEGMYTGLLTLRVAGAPLNSYAITYFVTVIPALAVSTWAYWMGLRGYKFTNVFVSENPEELEIKNEKRRRRLEEKTAAKEKRGK